MVAVVRGVSSAGNAGRYFYCTERDCGGGGGCKAQRGVTARNGRAALRRIVGSAGGANC